MARHELEWQLMDLKTNPGKHDYTHSNQKTESVIYKQNCELHVRGEKIAIYTCYTCY